MSYKKMYMILGVLLGVVCLLSILYVLYSMRRSAQHFRERELNFDPETRATLTAADRILQKLQLEGLKVEPGVNAIKKALPDWTVIVKPMPTQGMLFNDAEFRTKTVLVFHNAGGFIVDVTAGLNEYTTMDV